MIKMTHPEHGAMHAYSDAERTVLENAGWAAAPQKGAYIEVAPKEKTFNEVVTLENKRKPGRPPKAK